MRHPFSLIAVIAAAAVQLLSAPALADRAAADACATKLSPEAKLIFATVIGEVKPGANLPDVVRAKTRGLVMAGKLSRGQARPAAEQAGACLKQAL
jgi:hypothetical protein